MKNILKKEIQDYIDANLSTDLHSLLLKKSPFPEVSMQEIVQQIKGKKVAQKKFNFLLKEGVIFPPNLNLEQASSQATAEFKAENLSGKSFIDLTSGFGIDAYFLSQNFEEVFLVEQNPELLEIVQHNWKILGKNAVFFNNTLENFLAENQRKFDLIYLDPARRDAQKNKKFLLEDLSPNILEIQIIAVRNEVKELLILLEAEKSAVSPKIICTNLESEDAVFSFNYDEEKEAIPKFPEPLKYLCIPNNSVLKSGGFNILAQKFNLEKLAPNTHFYTSEDFKENFPGRVLEVEIINSNQIKKGESYNIISKNHPLSPEEIKKKYKIKDGGNRYLIFTQSLKSKIILRSL